MAVGVAYQGTLLNDGALLTTSLQVNHPNVRQATTSKRSCSFQEHGPAAENTVKTPKHLSSTTLASCSSPSPMPICPPCCLGARVLWNTLWPSTTTSCATGFSASSYTIRGPRRSIHNQRRHTHAATGDCDEKHIKEDACTAPLPQTAHVFPSTWSELRPPMLCVVYSGSSSGHIPGPFPVHEPLVWVHPGVQ
jgi:hypothetical protein